LFIDEIIILSTTANKISLSNIKNEKMQKTKFKNIDTWDGDYNTSYKLN
jgi:hypothetical protein